MSNRTAKTTVAVGGETGGDAAVPMDLRDAVAELEPAYEVARRLHVNRFRIDVRKRMAALRNRLYVGYEKPMLSWRVGRSLRILLSKKPEWQDRITAGFAGSPHQLMFGVIGPKSVEEFDVVVPLTVPDLLQMSARGPGVRRNPLPIPSQQSVELCDDKYVFSQAAIERGFGKYIPKIDEALKPPYILKKRVGSWGLECWTVLEHGDEQKVGDRLGDAAFYRQEIVRGRYEFATHVLFSKGKIVKALNIMYEFVSETPIKGQDRPLYLAICDCPYLGLFGEILESIGFEGLCCVNYKVADGRPYILEINPRFGGSLVPYFFSFVRHLELG